MRERSAQQSLGTVIFGGLVVATVLSLGVVPPVYVLVKNLEKQALITRQRQQSEFTSDLNHLMNSSLTPMQVALDLGVP